MKEYVYVFISVLIEDYKLNEIIIKICLAFFMSLFLPLHRGLHCLLDSAVIKFIRLGCVIKKSRVVELTRVF